MAQYPLNMTEKQKAEWQRLAQEAGVSFAEWLRQAASAYAENATREVAR